MEFIKPITSDSDLINLCDILDIKLDGILDLLEIKQKLPDKGTYIIILRNEPTIGHWIAVHNDVYFDSYGLPPPSILEVDTYYDKQIQGIERDYCGPFCVLWLYCMINDKMELFDYLFHNLNLEF